MMYFTATNLNELKVQYRRLAMEHHPDRGGDAEIMKAINNEHDDLFKKLSSAHNDAAAADATRKTRPTTETPEEFRKIIDILLHMDGLEVELCGAWLWIGGNTKGNREGLKRAGCKWSASKQLWYWHHQEAGSPWHSGKSSMSKIRRKYGSQLFRGGREIRKKIAAEV